MFWKCATRFLQGFLDKNRDLMRPDILSVLKNSDSRFVRDLLGECLAVTEVQSEYFGHVQNSFFVEGNLKTVVY